MEPEEMQCDACNGTGGLPYMACLQCNGTGDYTPAPEQRSVPNPFEPVEDDSGEEKPYFSATLDHDLIVVEFDDGIRSIAPHSIGNIKMCEDDVLERWVVRIMEDGSRGLAWFYFETRKEAREWHAHLHNLWRDARIVAGRSR